MSWWSGRSATSPSHSRARQIERLRRERPVAARLLGLRALAVLVIIGDRLEPRLERAGIAAVADDQVVVGEMVEQGRQPLLEQGQPMVDAGDPPPVRHRLVERIAGRGGAEQFAIGRAEALDAVLVEQGLGGGQQGEAVDPVDAALGGGIEAAHALDLVAEEIEPQRLLLAGGKQVDEAAAHRELAGIAHRLGAAIAIGLEQGREPVEVDPLAGREPGDELADAERRQRPLRRGVDGGDEQLRPGRLALQRVQASPAARRSRAATASCGRRAGSPRPGRSAPPAPARNNGAASASARIAASSGATNTARPLAARARSAASQGMNPPGTPASVTGFVAVRIFWRSSLISGSLM